VSILALANTKNYEDEVFFIKSQVADFFLNIGYMTENFHLNNSKNQI